MNERQFWNFAGLQPLAEKPWVTFMGRQVRVPNMPEARQKCLGVFDPQRPEFIRLLFLDSGGREQIALGLQDRARVNFEHAQVCLPTPACPADR